MAHGTDETRLLTLVEAIYRAATDPGAWTHALQAISAATGGSVVGVQAYDVARHRAALQAAVGASTEWQLRYEQEFAGLNPWFLGGAHAVRPGLVSRGEDVLDNRDLVRTRFHADFLAPQDLFHTAVAVVAADGGLASSVTLLRSRRRGPYEDHELELLGLLLPHLTRAVRLSRRLSGLAATRDALLEVLDREQTAAFLVDGAARLHLTNRLADDLLREGDGLEAARGTLQSADLVQQRALSAAIGKTAEGGVGAGGVLSLPRLGRLPLRVTVIPVRAPEAALVSAACVLVAVRDPERLGIPEPALLQDRFGLTRAEASVAVALVGGLSPAEISARHGTSLNTVRTHLKRIYSKVGVGRQPELVRVLIHEAGGPRAD